ncbi:MAG TPA: hypothetical protein VMR74_03325 [Gammaproteobacteria bacterium]|nr:hypothetical protein [Gammaproteobacteria bacterium]
MRTGLLALASLGVLSSAALAQAPLQIPEKDPDCDRACLEGYIDRYLVAMLEQDVSDNLFARNVRFTENGIELPLGNEGLWWGMSGLEGYRFYVPDIETQQIAFIGTVVENMANNGVNNDEGNNVAISIRLKIRDGLITEIEQLVSRPAVALGGRGGGGGGGGPVPGTTGDRVLAMGEPHPIFFEVIPEDERHTREELVEAGNHYFTALARHDSQGYYPFTEDCERWENGFLATDDCLANFTGDSLNGIVDRIRDRRFVAADTERGIVFAFAFFDHHRINWTWQLAELFKIENGLMRRIEAVFHQAPFGIPSGWSMYEQSISEEIQSVR